MSDNKALLFFNINLYKGEDLESFNQILRIESFIETHTKDS